VPLACHEDVCKDSDSLILTQFRMNDLIEEGGGAFGNYLDSNE
jgi:hypothetical protein